MASALFLASRASAFLLASRALRTHAPRASRPLSSLAQASVSLEGPEDTQALGACIAELSVAGDAVLLDGDYGAGKTCLARGFVQRWLSDPDELVTSPSYLIDNVYPDGAGQALQPGVEVHHMDLWRLPEGKASELVDLPRVFAECVCLIEWPEKLGAEAMPAQRLEVCLTHAGDPMEADEDSGRVARLTPVGESWARRMDALAASLQAAGLPVDGGQA